MFISCQQAWFLDETELEVIKHCSIREEIIVKVVHHINPHTRETIAANDRII